MALDCQDRDAGQLSGSNQKHSICLTFSADLFVFYCNSPHCLLSLLCVEDRILTINAMGRNELRILKKEAENVSVFSNLSVPSF